MENLIYLLVVVLSYKALMPFVAWIVPPDRMNNAAAYIERTERRFPTRDIVKWFSEWKQKRRQKKKP